MPMQPGRIKAEPNVTQNRSGAYAMAWAAGAAAATGGGECRGHRGSAPGHMAPMSQPMSQPDNRGRPGDWACELCGDHQFARNTACRSCGAGKPSGHGAGAAMSQPMSQPDHEGRPGDWTCELCGDHQFARNTACRKCGAGKPGGPGTGAAYGCKGAGAAYGCKGAGAAYGGKGARAMNMVHFDGKPGDWLCPECGDHQFARNVECRSCGCGRPETADMGLKPGDWICNDCGDLQFAKNVVCRKCGNPQPDDMEMPDMGKGSAHQGGVDMGGFISPLGGKPGDWSCPSCGDHQFARNEVCRRCGCGRPDGAGGCGYGGKKGGGKGPKGGGKGPMTGGDWACPACGDLQFERRQECRQCATPRPLDIPSIQGYGGGGAARLKPGDWTCPECGDLQFARNASCRRCGYSKLEGEGQVVLANTKPGDWICPGCQDLQFAKNENCRMCGTPKPEDEMDEDEIVEDMDALRPRSRSPRRGGIPPLA